MGIYTIRMPDIGEGIAEAELVEWHVKLGDVVAEDATVAVVMTDKAAVEVPSSVSGTVSWLGGDLGDLISVGGKLIQLEIDGEGNDTGVGQESDVENVTPAPAEAASLVEEVAKKEAVVAAPSKLKTNVAQPSKQTKPEAIESSATGPRAAGPRAKGTKPLAAPSVRARAKEEGIDLRHVPGTGPSGRINHQDLATFIENGGNNDQSKSVRPKNTDVKEIKVVGMRRKIAEKMATSKSRIPHITIVEEVDMTELEDLRSALNKKYAGARPKLTLLPFLMRTIVEAVQEQPEFNARYDDGAGVIHQHGGVHIGIATQTESGLNVTVAQHCETSNLWESASEVARLTESARDGRITRDELSGGTITISSLGALGAIATTPIINHPEVTIVGVNKMQIRPMWDGQQFQPRKMMNISCSFDHRVVDGWEAAVFVQKIKALLEAPAMLFVES